MRGVDRIEHTVDTDFLQLVNQDHGRIAIPRNVARRYRDRKPLVGAITELLHQLAGFGTVFCDIGVIARQRFEEFGRHAPEPSGWRHHGAADLALPVAEDVDKGLPVEAQRHRLAVIRSQVH